MNAEKPNPLAPCRGVVAAWTAMTMTVLLGFAALSIDIGYMYVVRAQLQNAADSAALAAASVYYEDIGLSQDQVAMTQVATARAQQYSKLNETMRKGTYLEAADVVLGRHDPDNPNGPLLTDGRWNAVEVTVRATAESANGAVKLFFANIFGKSQSESWATARAVADDRFVGYRLRYEPDLIPFTLQQDLYDQMANDGLDEYSFDGDVRRQSDGVPEIVLFPWRWDEIAGIDGAVDGSGNFGTLNVGLGSQGSSFLESQITDGIGPEELKAEFGTTELMFYDEAGDPQTYEATGNPGLSTGLKDTVEARIGDIVGFFIHNRVVLDGSNATYTITGIRFARLVAADLVGAPDRRAIILQPVSYTGGNVIVEDWGPTTNGLMGRITLVR